MSLFRFAEEYAKHSALNLGQTLHGLRHLLSHPDIDPVAPRGGMRHRWLSLRLRSRRVGNDLFYALMPPHWHHSKDDLQMIRSLPMRTWFDCGYAQWKYTETGARRTDLDGTEDRRWDARCHAPPGRIER